MKQAEQHFFVLSEISATISKKTMKFYNESVIKILYLYYIFLAMHFFIATLLYTHYMYLVWRSLNIKMNIFESAYYIVHTVAYFPCLDSLFKYLTRLIARDPSHCDLGVVHKLCRLSRRGGGSKIANFTQ